MSDQHIEGLRKAARRTFWEANQLEKKAATKPFDALRALIQPIDEALERAGEAIQDRFRDHRPNHEEGDFLERLLAMSHALNLVSAAMADMESGGDGRSVFTEQFQFGFADRYVPESVRNEVPEFLDLLQVLGLDPSPHCQKDWHRPALSKGNEK